MLHVVFALKVTRTLIMDIQKDIKDQSKYIVKNIKYIYYWSTTLNFNAYLL